MHTNTTKKNTNIVTGNVGHVSRIGHNTQKKQRFGHRNDKPNNHARPAIVRLCVIIRLEDGQWWKNHYPILKPSS